MTTHDMDLCEDVQCSKCAAIDPHMTEDGIAGAKHTQGLWFVESDGTTVSFGGQAVIVGPAPDGASREEAMANALLIAAAPDMLDALKRVEDYLAGRGRYHAPNVEAVVSAAIARATGGE